MNLMDAYSWGQHLAPSWCVDHTYESDIPALSSWWSNQVNYGHWGWERDSLQEHESTGSLWWYYECLGLIVPSTTPVEIC